jgi:hypothetical protein
MLLKMIKSGSENQVAIEVRHSGVSCGEESAEMASAAALAAEAEKLKRTVEHVNPYSQVCAVQVQ